MKKKVGLPPMLKKMMIAKALSGAGAPPSAPMGAPPGMKKGGSANKMNMGGMYAKGGSFKDRAASTKHAAHPDGIALRGKTKGTKVTMKNGGKC